KKTEPHCCGSALVLQFAPAVQAAEAPWQWLESAAHGAQAIRGEQVGGHVALVEDGAGLAFVGQRVGDIAAAVQVMEEGGASLPGTGIRVVVVIDQRVLPQLAAAVVVVRQYRMPGVLIEEQLALAVQVAAAFLDR